MSSEELIQREADTASELMKKIVNTSVVKSGIYSLVGDIMDAAARQGTPFSREDGQILESLLSSFAQQIIATRIHGTLIEQQSTKQILASYLGLIPPR